VFSLLQDSLNGYEEEALVACLICSENEKIAKFTNYHACPFADTNKSVTIYIIT